MRKRVLFLWRQEDTSSLRLLSVDSSGRQMISSFSLRQRLHLLLELLYGECDARMRQEIKCSMLLSLRVQICLLSSVEFLCLAWRNDAVWFLYLVLKSFSVSPMYVYQTQMKIRHIVKTTLQCVLSSFVFDILFYEENIYTHWMLVSFIYIYTPVYKNIAISEIYIYHIYV